MGSNHIGLVNMQCFGPVLTMCAVLRDAGFERSGVFSTTVTLSSHPQKLQLCCPRITTGLQTLAYENLP